MDEQQWSDQFDKDLTDLARGDTPDMAEMPPDYQQLLTLAQALSTPMHADSQIRASLRQRLLEEAQPRYASRWQFAALCQRPLARVSLALIAFILVGMLTTAPVSAWTYSMMLGVRSFSATVVPTASQTATLMPSSTTVAPTVAFERGMQASSAGTPIALTLAATAVPTHRSVLLTAAITP